MLRKAAITALCLCVIGTLGAGYAGATEEKKEPALDISSIGADMPFDLPKINELFEQAKMNGITAGWENRIELESIDYEHMSAPERAFVVGKVLADITYLVLDKEQGKPSANLLQKAEAAILSIQNLPEDIKTDLEDIKAGVTEGGLQGEALRKELDELVQTVLPRLRGEADPTEDAKTEKIDKQLQDVGMLITAAGFFRAMYLGASSVAKMDSPTPEQLSMFRYGSVGEHFIRYFTEDASKTFQDSRRVKDLVRSLKVIVPIVQKSKLSKSDIEKVSQFLHAQFK